MSWFNCGSNDNKDAIRDKIRDLESDLSYLEREASDARDKSTRYFYDYKDIISQNDYCENSESRDLLRESNYWGNVNSDICRKIDRLEDEIRYLEREL